MQITNLFLIGAGNDNVLWSAGVAEAQAATEAAAEAEAAGEMVRGERGGDGASGGGGAGGGGGGAREAEPEGAAAQTAAPGDVRARAHRLCSEYLRGAWRDAAPHQLRIRKISGGLSNLLFEVALTAEAGAPGSGAAAAAGGGAREAAPERVLLRLYGQLPPCGVDCVRDGLVTEAVVFTLLSESQRGPRLLGVFPGGRLEEYIPARPLLTKELSDSSLSVLIAEKMAQIHMMNVPINKEPHWLWDTMERWLETISAFMGKDQVLPQFQNMCGKLHSYNLREELTWLKKFLVKANSPVVFCHNDLQEGNILLRNDNDQVNENMLENVPNDSVSEHVYNDKKLVVIDFEYCAYNYRGFDFANHMCEWTYDYSNENHPYFWARSENFPTKEQQELFFQSYLKTIRNEQENANNNSDDSQMEIERMLNETKAFILASHFFWGLWSVVNATVSKITFDYWAYGEDRFKAYFKHKSNLLSDDSSPEEINIHQPT